MAGASCSDKFNDLRGLRSSRLQIFAGAPGLQANESRQIKLITVNVTSKVVV